MKKKYYNSPIAPIFVFVVGSVWECIFLLIKGGLWTYRINYFEFLIEWGLLCFLIWIGMMIEIDPPTMKQRIFFFFIKTHDISEVEDSKIVTASDIYGTDKFVQIRFKGGDKWNLAMFSKKDVQEILETIKRHQ